MLVTRLFKSVVGQCAFWGAVIVGGVTGWAVLADKTSPSMTTAVMGAVLGSLADMFAEYWKFGPWSKSGNYLYLIVFNTMLGALLGLCGGLAVALFRLFSRKFDL
jgi:hypothetical protein